MTKGNINIDTSSLLKDNDSSISPEDQAPVKKSDDGNSKELDTIISEDTSNLETSSSISETTNTSINNEKFSTALPPTSEIPIPVNKNDMSNLVQDTNFSVIAQSSSPKESKQDNLSDNSILPVTPCHVPGYIVSILRFNSKNSQSDLLLL